jgi:hypothetical protein
MTGSERAVCGEKANCHSREGGNDRIFDFLRDRSINNDQKKGGGGRSSKSNEEIRNFQEIGK